MSRVHFRGWGWGLGCCTGEASPLGPFPPPSCIGCMSSIFMGPVLPSLVLQVCLCWRREGALCCLGEAGAPAHWASS